MPREVANPRNHYSLSPASHAAKAGNTIYVTGQCALDGDLNVLHPGDLVAQTEIVMSNIAKVLAEFGATMDDVVKMNTFYVSEGQRDDWEASVRARFKHFKVPGPASTGIPVPALAIPGLMIEVEVIAFVGEKVLEQE